MNWISHVFFTIACHYVLSLCTITVRCQCVLALCTVTVRRHCVSVLCTVTMLVELCLSPCRCLFVCVAMRASLCVCKNSLNWIPKRWLKFIREWSVASQWWWLEGGQRGVEVQSATTWGRPTLANPVLAQDLIWSMEKMSINGWRFY